MVIAISLLHFSNVLLYTFVLFCFIMQLNYFMEFGNHCFIMRLNYFMEFGNQMIISHYVEVIATP